MSARTWIVRAASVLASLSLAGVIVLAARWWLVPPDRTGTKEFRAAEVALNSAANGAVADLMAHPQSYFVKKVSDCHVLQLSPNYLGQICVLPSIAEPISNNDFVTLATQGPNHVDDGWYYGSVETYFSDPFPHRARMVAQVGRDLVVQHFAP